MTLIEENYFKGSSTVDSEWRQKNCEGNLFVNIQMLVDQHLYSNKKFFSILSNPEKIVF